MTLSTEFDGIDPKNVDERIDALKQEIDNRLKPIIEQIQQLAALERGTSSWYKSNVVSTVHAAVNDAADITKQGIEDGITGERAEPRESDIILFSPRRRFASSAGEGSGLLGRIEKFMEKRPEWTIGAFFKGQVRNQKITFLDDLKEKGEQLLSEADTQLEKTKETLEELRTSKWQEYETVKAYYENLTQAITAEDTQAIIKVLNAEETKAIKPSVRSDLFLKPVNQFDNALLAIADADLGDAKQEGEVVANVLNSFDNDYEALRVIQGTVPKITDDQLRERYQAYANAFSGTFIPVGNNVVNANMVGYADENSVIIPGCNTGSRGYPKTLHVNDDSGAVFAALVARPNFVKIGKYAINTNRIGYADENSVIVPGSNASNRGYPKTLSVNGEDQEALNALADRPNFMRINDYVVNLNMVGYASAHGVIVPGSNASNRGYPKTLGVGDDAENVLEAIEAHRNFVRIGENVINTNRIGYASAHGVIVPGSNASNRGYPKTLSVGDDAESVLSMLAERPNFIRIGENVVNLNMIGYADEDRVIVPSSNTSNRGAPKSLGMGADAKAVLEALEEHPNFIRIGQNLVNVNMIGYADEDRVIVPSCNTSNRGAPKSLGTGADAKAILAALEKRPNFVRLGDHVVNANRIGYADENSAIVPGCNTGSRGAPKSLGISKDPQAVKKLRQLGQRLGILGTYGAERDQLMYGLREARAWEQDYSTTHQNNTDSSMDYLPLIIVGAIILFSDYDHVDPVVDAQDIGNDVGTDFDTNTDSNMDAGVDVDNDFGSAAGLDDIDTALDSDFGVDSFASDYDDMSSGMDSGFDDFDVGGGMDTSGGLDIGSTMDIGGGGMDIGGMGF